jgi:uncharacterized membrane protein YbaN (DUF454 family)
MMTQASPRHRVAAPNGVRISATAGRIQIVSAGLFSNDDRLVRTLVRRLFLQDAVRLVKIDRTQTLIEIHYNDAILDPHTALTIFSAALRSAGSDDPPSPLDDFLERVPGNLCRVERCRNIVIPRAAARVATRRVLSRFKRFARHGGASRGSAASQQPGILVGATFIFEYRRASESVTPKDRENDANGSPGMRLWDRLEPESSHFERPQWLANFPLVDVYRLGNLAAAGGCFVMSGVGLVTPGIPTVPFVLATSYFLARSSPELNERLKRSELFGQMIRDWDQHRALRSSTKIKTVGLTVVIMGITVAMADISTVLLLGLLAMGGLGTYLVLRIPTLPKESPLLPALV